MGGGVSAEMREEGLKLSGEVDESTKEQLNQIWTTYDKDNSGHIEKKELAKMLEDMCKPMEALIPIPSKMRKEMCE